MTYNVELAAGTSVVPTVVATVTDSGKANVVVTAAGSLPGTTTVVVTAEDGTTTKTYTVNFTVAPNAAQAAPIGLAGVAPTVAGNDGKITGTTTAMEYKLATADDSTYAACSDTATTVAAAGDYVVRLAAKTGFNAGATAVVTVPAYVTASSNGIMTATGTTTITLGQAITGLEAGDIVVKVGETALDNSANDKYIFGGLGTTSVTVAFLPGAALDNTSVVTVEITKAGYVLNGGAAIAVTNTIPAVL